jgi:hypothetical protein
MLANRRKAPITVALFNLICLVGLIAGCGGTQKIKNLLDDPAQFDGKTVQVSGEVTENVGAMGYGLYVVDDGTGVITVLAKQGGAPRQGAKISVKGMFRSGFTFGSTSMAVIEEEKRKTRD